jgi:hypothetical protein
VDYGLCRQAWAPVIDFPGHPGIWRSSTRRPVPGRIARGGRGHRPPGARTRHQLFRHRAHLWVRKKRDPVFDFSYDGIMRTFEDSLKRLNLAYVDILNIHDPSAHSAPQLWSWSNGWRSHINSPKARTVVAEPIRER